MKCILLVPLFAASLWAQVAAEANSRYRTPEQRAAMAAGLDSPGRDSRQRPAELVEAMAIKPGMTVADVGTGAGYMLPHLSRAVGPSGKVLAEDIFDDFLAKASEKIEREKLHNVSIVKGTDKDPNLPAESVDVILTLDAYHHYDYPEEMLAGMRKALRPGGRLVLVDFYRRPGAMRNPASDFEQKHIRVDKADVVKEVEAAGFSLVSNREHIPDSQYMLIFVKR
jgi:ubiquinone/menaquinone biosynthesis C-methylase UbiE